jgi:hypothetical protein
MQKIIDADKHNFGQFVKPTERASGVWYCKPRPLFWEHLLFGKDSPLAVCFSDRGENGDAAPGTYLFNLDVEVKNDWLGFAKEVKQVSIHSPTLQHFYAFGVLLAYAYALGVRDLHKNNLILTETHLQVIDAEIVLTDLILPNETVLLPFKDIAFDRCGANSLAQSLSDFSTNDRRQIFAGYFDVFAILHRRQKEIQTTLENATLTAPIRVIVRNTRVYKRHQDGTTQIHGLLAEERVQLERGDIPYFFKKCDDGNLYWLSSANGAESIVSSFGEFGPDIARHAQIPAKLVGAPTTIERKMIQGAFLLQKLLVDSAAYDFAWNGKRLLLNADGCENQFTGQTFRKKLAAQ